jgi:polyhydroxyalkanoate synthesis regulator phasin
MSRIDDARRMMEGLAGQLTPAKAQEIAKSYLEPGAAKEQVAKAAADLLEWSQRNRERVRELVAREVQQQVKQMGVATQDELDGLRKRVRDLERQAGMTASGRAKSTTRSTAKRTSRASTSKTTPKTAAKPKPDSGS